VLNPSHQDFSLSWIGLVNTEHFGTDNSRFCSSTQSQKLNCSLNFCPQHLNMKKRWTLSFISVKLQWFDQMCSESCRKHTNLTANWTYIQVSAFVHVPFVFLSFSCCFLMFQKEDVLRGASGQQNMQNGGPWCSWTVQVLHTHTEAVIWKSLWSAQASVGSLSLSGPYLWSLVRACFVPVSGHQERVVSGFLWKDNLPDPDDNKRPPAGPSLSPVAGKTTALEHNTCSKV